MIRWLYLLFFAATVCWSLPGTLWANNGLLDLVTHSEIDSEGNVKIHFQVRNMSNRTLFKLHPIFHFHHVMSRMPVIPSLESGERRTLINTKHPRVLRVGRYPLIAMVRYSTSQNSSQFIIQNYMNSFYFKEKLQSVVEGRIQSEPKGEESVLKIFLKNKARSFKNIRLMLLLPPGLQVEAFEKGILGFTIQGGEEKQFKFSVSKKDILLGRDYPVYLMIEYGEMQKHYSNEVAGTVHFRFLWQETPIWIHVLIFFLIGIFLFLVYRIKQENIVRNSRDELRS